MTGIPPFKYAFQVLLLLHIVLFNALHHLDSYNTSEAGSQINILHMKNLMSRWSVMHCYRLNTPALHTHFEVNPA